MRARGVSSVQGRAGWARARACAGRSRGAASVNPRGAMPCTAEMQGDLPSVLQLAAAALQGAGAASGRLGSGGIPQPASRQSPAHVRSGWCPWLSRARWACWAGQQQAQASGLRQQLRQGSGDSGSSGSSGSKAAAAHLWCRPCVMPGCLVLSPGSPAAALPPHARVCHTQARCKWAGWVSRSRHVLGRSSGAELGRGRPVPAEWNAPLVSEAAWHRATARTERQSQRAAGAAAGSGERGEWGERPRGTWGAPQALLACSVAVWMADNP